MTPISVWRSIACRFAAVAVAIACGMSVSVLARPAAMQVAAAPSKAELGAMLNKCSQAADAKGLTVQKGKGEERKTFRRQCMLKNGVAPRKS